jgi:hypothetical protein
MRQILTGFEVRTAYEMGWDRSENGRLLTAAEQAGFSIMVSADQNIWHQQRLAGRRIALVVLTTNHWETIKADPARLTAACRGACDGDYIVLRFPKPPRLRRPPPLTPS